MLSLTHETRRSVIDEWFKVCHWRMHEKVLVQQPKDTDSKPTALVTKYEQQPNAGCEYD